MKKENQVRQQHNTKAKQKQEKEEKRCKCKIKVINLYIVLQDHRVREFINGARF